MENNDKKTGLVTVSLENTVKTNYLDYAMSVIVGRALPDIRDGLKPVHRRVLFTMNQMGVHYNRPYLKSARVVGDVMGKYHPHGDSAIYDTLVRMAQTFSLRYPLVDGQGNFGSVDGDSAAAMRYTECRMQRVTQELMSDLDKNTVDFTPNYDGSLEEPVVFPTKIPNLLINGTTGIAVGMATNIPPHNLTEVMNALIYRIDNPESTIDDIVNIIKAPDFPTKGIIMGRSSIVEAYKTGRGSFKIRAKAEIEELKNGKEQIIVTEIPYQVNKAILIEKIAELVNSKKITGISDLRDESDENIRIVIELKKGEISEVILNQLYKYTSMESSFGFNMVVLINNRPKLVSLMEILDEFIAHRLEVVTRRTMYLLKKAEDRLHIIEGLKIAVENIDRIVSIIKNSENTEKAKLNIMEAFSLTAIQTQAILDMRLSKLTGLEIDKLNEEHLQILEDIKGYKLILSERDVMMSLIKKEMNEIIENYGDDRSTDIVENDAGISIIDLIPNEDMAVTMTHNGYIKRTPLMEFTAQKRGGKGKNGASSRVDDFVERLIITSNHSQLIFFTARGKIYYLNVYNLPEMARDTKGRHISNFIPLENGDKIASALSMSGKDDDKCIFFGTKKGIIKRISISEFKSGRSGILAMKLDDDDELVSSLLTDEDDKIFMASKQAKSIQFFAKEIKARKRISGGIKGMRLAKDDSVVSIEVFSDDGYVMTVTQNGYGKRTPIGDYREQARGGAGLRLCKINSKTGPVVSAHQVSQNDEIMIITKNGKTIRFSVDSISVLNRDTQGVKLMDTNGDEIISAAIIKDTAEMDS